MNIHLKPQAWEDLFYWIRTDKKAVRKIEELVKDIIRNNPFKGIGKPEPLKHDWQGWWSRHITQEHRMVYKVEDGNLVIAQLRYHY